MTCSFFEEAGVPERHVHQQGQLQFEYNDFLTSMIGDDVPLTPEWRLSLWRHARELKKNYSPTEYRDRWDDEEAIRITYEAFESLESQHAQSANSTLQPTEPLR
jgi:hypothetical protein